MAKLPNDFIVHFVSDDGINITIQKTKLIYCKDCIYYEPQTDPAASDCQRLWGGMIECKPDSYCSDAVPKKENKNDL